MYRTHKIKLEPKKVQGHCGSRQLVEDGGLQKGGKDYGKDDAARRFAVRKITSFNLNSFLPTPKVM